MQHPIPEHVVNGRAAKDEEQRLAGLQLGNTAVVPKPYKKEELGITTTTSWDGEDVRRGS